MVILALDTTSRAGSVAVAVDDRVMVARVGDPSRTHGERLPEEIASTLEAAGYRVTDVDLYAVAVGPGSFTGLRVGIATIQGLAMALGRRVVAVPTLEALAYAAAWSTAPGDVEVILACQDAQRQEVFAALYRLSAAAEGLDVMEPAVVGSAERVLAGWSERLMGKQVLAVGDASASLISALDRLGAASHRADVGPPAATLARLAWQRAGNSVPPHAIRPVYVRRSDAELARDRGRQTAGGRG